MNFSQPTPKNARFIGDYVKRFVNAVSEREILVALDTSAATITLRRKKIDSASEDWGDLSLSFDTIENLSHSDVDRWSLEAFDRNFPDLAAMFFDEFVGRNDAEDDLFERWRRFLMIRGFISPFHPGKGIFSKRFARRFVMSPAIALDASCGHVNVTLSEGSFQIRVFPDGTGWSAVFEPFVNMVSTPTEFGETPAEAILKLVMNHIASMTKQNSSP